MTRPIQTETNAPYVHRVKKHEIVHGLRVLALCLLFAHGMAGSSQQTATSAQGEDQRYAQFEKQLQDLARQLGQTQKQLEDAREQIRALQDRLKTLRNAKSATAASPRPSSAYDNLQQAVEQLKEESRVQQSEIHQHEQTKIETVSKYPVKVSGLLLFNAFLNDGRVDDIDLPIISIPVMNGQSSGSVGATLRQTILGLSATGPKLGNARSSADVQIDFFGGLANSAYLSSAGVVRMRTADLNLDWTRTSITAGFQGPLVSPLSPTSYATVGEPALAWSGNLWVWAPQISVKRELSLARGSHADLQVGVYDPALWGSANNSSQRQATPGESSKRPGLESRISYADGEDMNAMEIGIGGYFSPQRYGDGQSLDAWAGTLDWQIPFSKYFAFSGEFYRGNAIGDLGGGTFKDVVNIYDETTDDSHVQGLNDVGGWSQLKLTPTRSFEFNTAFGIDNGFAQQLVYANPWTSNPQPTGNPYMTLARNRTMFGNVIYRPREYLLFSAEYRAISSWQVYGTPNTANVITLSAGYIF